MKKIIVLIMFLSGITIGCGQSKTNAEKSAAEEKPMVGADDINSPIGYWDLGNGSDERVALIDRNLDFKTGKEVISIYIPSELFELDGGWYRNHGIPLEMDGQGKYKGVRFFNKWESKNIESIYVTINNLLEGEGRIIIFIQYRHSQEQSGSKVVLRDQSFKKLSFYEGNRRYHDWMLKISSFLIKNHYIRSFDHESKCAATPSELDIIDYTRHDRPNIKCLSQLKANPIVDKDLKDLLTKRLQNYLAFADMPSLEIVEMMVAIGASLTEDYKGETSLFQAMIKNWNSMGYNLETDGKETPGFLEYPSIISYLYLMNADLLEKSGKDNYQLFGFLLRNGLLYTAKKAIEIIGFTKILKDAPLKTTNHSDQYEYWCYTCHQKVGFTQSPLYELFWGFNQKFGQRYENQALQMAEKIVKDKKIEFNLPDALQLMTHGTTRLLVLMKNIGWLKIDHQTYNELKVLTDKALVHYNIWVGLLKWEYETTNLQRRIQIETLTANMKWYAAELK